MFIALRARLISKVFSVKKNFSCKRDSQWKIKTFINVGYNHLRELKQLQLHETVTISLHSIFFQKH